MHRTFFFQRKIHLLNANKCDTIWNILEVEIKGKIPGDSFVYGITSAPGIRMKGKGMNGITNCLPERQFGGMFEWRNTICIGGGSLNFWTPGEVWTEL